MSVEIVQSPWRRQSGQSAGPAGYALVATIPEPPEIPAGYKVSVHLLTRPAMCGSRRTGRAGRVLNRRAGGSTAGEGPTAGAAPRLWVPSSASVA